MKQGFAFEFDPPRGWLDFKDGDRFVFQGPHDEELIVSGAVVTGQGNPATYAAIREALRRNAINSMTSAVNVPDVRVVSPLREATTPQGLRAWYLDAETSDRSTTFLQATIEAEGGVLLVTFEAPRSEGNHAVFQDFVEHVQPVAGGRVAG